MVHECFVVEGEKGVNDLLCSNIEVLEVFISSSDIPIPDGAKIRSINEREMASISALTSPPGILAVARLPEWYLKPDSVDLPQTGMTLYLDGLRDPGNMGTIIRTAAWFGNISIVASKDSVDCFNPKVVQASMGALFTTPVRYTSLKSLLTIKQTRVYGLDLAGENIYATTISEGVFVIGNESEGLRPDARELCHSFLNIPGVAGTESLNASVSAGILMSEIYRKTH